MEILVVLFIGMAIWIKITEWIEDKCKCNCKDNTPTNIYNDNRSVTINYYNDNKQYVQKKSYRYKATNKAIEQAKEVLRIQEDKLKSGKATLTDYLDAQSSLLNIQANYYAILAQYHIAQAELKFMIEK